MSASLSTTLAQLQSDVAAQTTVAQSAVTLLNGLSAQLKTALGEAVSTGDLTALTALDASLTANTTALSAAVTANTPPVTPTPPAGSAPAA